MIRLARSVMPEGGKDADAGWRQLFPFLLRLLTFEITDLGVHADILAAALSDHLARDEIIALHRALGGFVELFRPFAERIAVPGLLGLQRRQAELFPDLLGALHIGA